MVSRPAASHVTKVAWVIVLVFDCRECSVRADTSQGAAAVSRLQPPRRLVLPNDGSIPVAEVVLPAATGGAARAGPGHRPVDSPHVWRCAGVCVDVEHARKGTPTPPQTLYMVFSWYARAGCARRVGRWRLARSQGGVACCGLWWRLNSNSKVCACTDLACRAASPVPSCRAHPRISQR